MPKKERDSLFVEMFRKAKPFEEGMYYQSEHFQALEGEYAYWDIELQKRCDGDLRKIKEQLTVLRTSMEPYRDYHYFVQGTDQMIEYLRARLPILDSIIEGVNLNETEKEPLQ